MRPACRSYLLTLVSSWVLLETLPGRGAEPEIVGTARFSNQVQHAMVLLRMRDTNAYAIVTNCVGRIQEGERSGMWAYRTPPTYEMSDTSAFYSVTWCAAVVAHDSFHSKLYRDYRKDHGDPVPDSVWTGTVAEQQCVKFQLSVMEHIGASTGEIEYARKQAGGNYVKDGETWSEYKRRRW
jgi:hypothetical protein